MSWYYSINGGDYESKDKQSLRAFLDNVAAHLDDNRKHSLQIKTLDVRYVFGMTDGYSLPTGQAQDYLDRVLADYESDADQAFVYGTYHQQVQSTYQRAVL